MDPFVQTDLDHVLGLSGDVTDMDRLRAVEKLRRDAQDVAELRGAIIRLGPRVADLEGVVRMLQAQLSHRAEPLRGVA
jgi:hypothetical protein